MAEMDSRAQGCGGPGIRSAGTGHGGTSSGLLWARRLRRVKALGHTGARQGLGQMCMVWYENDQGPPFYKVVRQLKGPRKPKSQISPLLRNSSSNSQPAE